MAKQIETLFTLDEVPPEEWQKSIYAATLRCICEWSVGLSSSLFGATCVKGCPISIHYWNTVNTNLIWQDLKLRNSVGHTIGSSSYVPIDEVLTIFCFHQNELDQILSETSPETDNEFLTDYCNCSIFKEHLVFKEHPKALRLNFYEDEFEVVNPLGSKRENKSCMHFFTVWEIWTKGIDLSRDISIWHFWYNTLMFNSVAGI